MANVLSIIQSASQAETICLLTEQKAELELEVGELKTKFNTQTANVEVSHKRTILSW